MTIRNAQYVIRMSACLCLLVLCLPAIVSAHQPYCEFADLTAEALWQVPEPAISYAYFGNVYPGWDIDYFAFDAHAGQSILLSLSIPANDENEDAIYAPLTAVIGPGLPGDLPPELPEGLQVPADAGVKMVALGDAPSRVINLDARDAPSLELQVYRLADGSYNLQLQTSNFSFRPQNIDKAPVIGEGHAHLYVDGLKLARIYGQWHHLPTLPPHAELLTVSLYANNHQGFAVNGEVISASVRMADLGSE